MADAKQKTETEALETRLALSLAEADLSSAKPAADIDLDDSDLFAEMLADAEGEEIDLFDTK